MVKLQGKFQQSKFLQQEVEALLTKKSKEATSLSEERTKLLAEVERLKEELTRKDGSLLRRKRPSPTTLLILTLWGLRRLSHKPRVFILRWISLSLTRVRPWSMGSSWKSNTFLVTHNI